MSVEKIIGMEKILQVIGEYAIPITGKVRYHRSPLAEGDPKHRKIYYSMTGNEYDKILDSIGNAQVVMIGEASHGTDDFYKHRSEITKRLIEEKGFNIVAVEADWPDAYRANNYVQGGKDCKDQNANEALGDFHRFPRWMWRNHVVVEFLEWMRAFNRHKTNEENKAGFYGLDMYSFSRSKQEVLNYLEKVDPILRKKAAKYYACFDRFGCEDELTSQYSLATSLGMSKSCEEEALQAVKTLFMHAKELLEHDPSETRIDRLFYAQQNAKIVKDAESYYRNMMAGSNVTWNIRDTHMCNTLIDLMEFMKTKYSSDFQPKAVIWAHNSHLGDARETDAGWGSRRGGREVNLGMLARKHFGLSNTFNIGFTTHHGTVTAAHNWDEEPHTFHVNDGMDGSWEELFHHAAIKNFPEHSPDFMLIFRTNQGDKKRKSELAGESEKVSYKDATASKLHEYLATPRYERAIGVIYRPKTELQSHYFKARLPQQFDAIIHIDRSHALTPLETEQEHGGAADETFPTGL